MQIHSLRANRNRRRIVSGAIFVGVLLEVMILSQPQFTALLLAAPAQSSSGNTLRVDVELITVEVIAQDKKGKPILNMTKEDFRLLEEGKQQKVVTFDAVNDKTDQPLPTSLSDVEDQPHRGKVVLILFDDSTITPSQTKFTRDSAETYVKQHMKPWDLFGVASYGLSLKIVQNFTHDAGKIIEAIRQPALSYANPALGPKMTREDQQPDSISGRRGRTSPAGSLGQNPAATQEAKFRAVSVLRTLNSLASSMSRVKGRKSILLFSEDFSITSDAHTELRSAVDNAQRSNVSFYTIDARGLNSNTGGQGSQSFLSTPKARRTGEPDRPGLFSLSAIAKRLFPLADLLDTQPASALLSSMFQQKGGGGQTTGGQGGQTGQGGTGQGSGNTGTSSGTSRDGSLGNTQPGDRSTNDSTSPQNRNDRSGNRDALGRDEAPNFERESTVDHILRSLAQDTGGLAIFKVDLELSNYYVLGFYSDNPKRDGKFRKLEVKTQLKGVKLKYRKGYADPRPLDALAGSKGERSLMTAISSPTPLTQLPVTFRPVYFYDSPELARIPIAAKIKRGTLELKKKGGQLANAVDIMGVAYAEDGSVAARFSETLNIAVDKDKEEAFRNQDISYRNYLKLRPGKYQVKVAMADEKGKVGTAEQTLAVPPMSASGLAASSLVVSQQLAQLPELIQNLQARLLDETDPLIYKGFQISMAVENQINRQYPMAIFYKLYNLKGDAAGKSLTAKLQFTDEKGQVNAFPPIALDQSAFGTGRGEVAIGLNLPVKDLAPGKYQLTVETTDSAANQSVSSQTELILQ
ncbi:MAG: hypothetical protein DMG05_13370 [Acidobacteria bacterium]|nr:MAG: hypothetical protein DMG05_13370 [Acidobacteriota bacterium]